MFVNIRVLKLRSTDWKPSLNYRIFSVHARMILFLLFSCKSCSEHFTRGHTSDGNHPSEDLSFNVMLCNRCCQNPQDPSFPFWHCDLWVTPGLPN